MAKIALTEELGGYKWLADYYSSSLTLESSSSTEAHFTDDATGSKIVFFGVGLQFTDGHLSGGSVTAVQLLDQDDALLVDITEGSYSAAALATEDIYDLLAALSAGDDTITSSDLGTDMNVLDDNRGDDIIIAGDGGSNMGGSEGDDTYTGGADWDTLSFQDAHFHGGTKGVKLNAALATVTDAWGDKDTFSGIEEYQGTKFKDTLVGSAGDDALMGLAGADKINGGVGTDTVRYHRDEHYDGNKGIVADLNKGTVIDGFGDKDIISNVENVYGTYKADKFIGDNEDNQFRGISGKDSFSGGKGTDAVGFDWWEDLGQHGINVDLSLAKNQIKDDGFGNTETTKGIEAVEGSSLDDTIKLGKSNGWAWGGDGDDTLTAGIGSQWFGGGNGADKFIFQALASLGTSEDNQDQIDDFSQADGDTIDLSGIGGLVFKGTAAFTNTAGELRYEQVDGNTIVYGDTDGDGTANFQLKINLAVDLMDDDFVL